MAYKVFVAGEEALASDVNSLLMAQTVPRFTNAAQRSSQLTAPGLNQLSMTDDLPGVISHWNGSSWVASGQAAERFVAQNFGGNLTPGNQVLPVTSFTMPFTGAIFLQGAARFDPGAGASAALCNVLVTAAGSTPAATPSLQWVGPGLAGTSYYDVMPLNTYWLNVAKGTAVTLAWTMATNANVVQLTHWIFNIRLTSVVF